MANRILAYLHCDCCRRRQRDERLKAIASDLADRMVSDLVSVESFDGEIHATIICSWEILETDHAAGELAELLKEVAHNLDAAALRLEGGQA